MLNVDQIFILHYAPLAERKKYLSKQIANLGIDTNLIEWIEEEPSYMQSLCMYDFGQMWDDKVFGNKNYNKRVLRQSEISLAYKHIFVYQTILQKNITSSLVLEDDVIFCNDFIKNFNLYLYNSPADWDIIFPGSGCDLHIDKKFIVPDKTSYKKEYPATRCTDSYLIKKACIEKIYNSIIPFTLPIDFELNYQLEANRCVTYWWEPTLIYQGSQNNMFTSSIQ